MERPQPPHVSLAPLNPSTRVGRLRADGLSRRDVDGAPWERVFHGVARPAGLSHEAPDGRIGAVLGLLDDGCRLGGWAARRLHGGAFADGVDRHGREVPVLLHLDTPGRRRARAGLHVTHTRVHPEERTLVEGVPTVTLARAAYDEMLLARHLAESVVALDMAVSTTVRRADRDGRERPGARTTLAEVARVVDTHAKTRGIVNARRALGLASTRSASPWETRTRLVAAGCDEGTRWLANVPVFGPGGRLLGVVDLLDVLSGVVVETDGAGHRGARTHAEDNVREEGLETTNLLVVRISPIDHRQPALVANRIWTAVQRGRARDRSADRWTLDRPPWWADWQHAARWS